MEETLQASARIDVSGQAGKPFKAYSNHYYEIWQLPNGKIKAQIITTFEAHQPGLEKKPHPVARRILRVFQRDIVRLERDNVTVTGCVQKLTLGNGLFIAPHAEANAAARNLDQSDEFSFIKISAGPLVKANARRVCVDEMGRLRDPGPPKLR